MPLGNTMTNAIRTFLEGCAESWGLPLSNTSSGVFDSVHHSLDMARPNNTQNTSKNKALLDFEFVARLTFRVDSEYSGEQAHV